MRQAHGLPTVEVPAELAASAAAVVHLSLIEAEPGDEQCLTPFELVVVVGCIQGMSTGVAEAVGFGEAADVVAEAVGFGFGFGETEAVVAFEIPVAAEPEAVAEAVAAAPSAQAESQQHSTWHRIEYEGKHAHAS